MMSGNSGMPETYPFTRTWRPITLARTHAPGTRTGARAFGVTRSAWSSAVTHHEVATLAGGCFWCLEAAFSDLKGVERVESGYAGGSVPNPSYEAVCTGRTGHAEVVQITFDQTVISFSD